MIWSTLLRHTMSYAFARSTAINIKCFFCCLLLRRYLCVNLKEDLRLNGCVGNHIGHWIEVSRHQIKHLFTFFSNNLLSVLISDIGP